MELLGSIIYGFISGLTEIVPVSSHANQHLLRQLLGVQNREPVRDMLVHIAALAALLFACRSLILRIRRDMSFAARVRRGKNGGNIPGGVYEMRLLRSAAAVLAIGLLAGIFLPDFTQSSLLFAAFCMINGVILMVPSHMHQGNKTAKVMTGVDGMLIGLAGALSVFTGISRVGSMVSMSILCKTDKTSGFSWALLLSIPALAVLCLVDFVGIFTVGVGAMTLATVVGYLLSAAAAFAGTYVGVTLMKIIVERMQLAGFAYYSFGIALLSFLIYLIT